MFSVMFYWLCLSLSISAPETGSGRKINSLPVTLFTDRADRPVWLWIVSFLFLKTIFIMVYEGLNDCPIWLCSNWVRFWGRVTRRVTPMCLQGILTADYGLVQIYSHRHIFQARNRNCKTEVIKICFRQFRDRIAENFFTRELNLSCVNPAHSLMTKGSL